MHPLQQSETNRLLGYPADARLLILNADDLGMCHAVNEAIFTTLKQGVVTSTSLMVPYPGAPQAMRILGENPDIPFGVHLTILCDSPDHRWGPLTRKERVPSLIDETGLFYNLDRQAELMARATLDDLEVEFRAQIETVLAAQLKPTHLDWHCLHNGGRADIFDLSFRLAQEYGLALRAYGSPFMEQLRAAGLPADEHGLLDSYDVDIDRKTIIYTQLLRDLPIGLSEWAVHPGLGNDEMQTIEPNSWRVRQTDYDFMLTPEARQIIEQEGITLLSYKPLQKIWQAR